MQTSLTHVKLLYYIQCMNFRKLHFAAKLSYADSFAKCSVFTDISASKYIHIFLMY